MNDDFFKLLAVESRVTDVSSVRAVYYGLCRMMLKELIVKNSSELPDLGKFKIKKHSRRQIRNIRTGELQLANESTTVKFIPDQKMRTYVNLKLGT